VRFND